ncbi:hypothetical protein EJ05DRAFT_283801 [Pseudovirgaria hyperparasitica]|uniref:Uncharacterized protein n=1 Tax=Pseudovirgaria hyperparasitica TaxID=470096 RepID=A0A6A6WFQ7_9PEZI|nr:uncharacterized protein EJ05DRAFT_283801 [Pseudovirgaria hyperparasitica]KAF2760427.1 hypothetical protein EJ05DRAFT_283801 [Pseudovirgaria hyperparasitica]
MRTSLLCALLGMRLCRNKAIRAEHRGHEETAPEQASSYWLIGMMPRSFSAKKGFPTDLDDTRCFSLVGLSHWKTGSP